MKETMGNASHREVQTEEHTFSFDIDLLATQRHGVIQVEGRVPAADLAEVDRNALLNAVEEAAKGYGIRAEEFGRLALTEEGDIEFSLLRRAA